MSSPVLDAALKYAAHGWPVFPCSPLKKKPRTTNGFKDASTDPAVIAAWWEKWPNAMIGVPTGDASGLVTLDVDVDAAKGIDGEASLEALANGKRMPTTLAARTPRGGRHYHFAYPDGAAIHNSAGKLGRGLDIRGECGYVIMPPSANNHGKAYQWDPWGEAAPLPLWILEKLQERPPSAERQQALGGGRLTDERLYAYGDAALVGECGKVLSAPEGERNATLFSAACNLFELVCGGSLNDGRVRDHLTYAARATGLDAKEIGATLDSAAARVTKSRGPRERNGGHVASSGSGPAAQTDEPDRKPMIRLGASLTVVAESSEQAILAAGLPVYVGAAGLVYPAAKEVETVEDIRTTVAQLVQTTTPMMMQFMDQAARYERYDGRRSAWVPAKPPKDIAELMLVRRGFWPYPEVVAVITAPTIDVGGNLIMSPGLDRKSKLLLSGAPVIEMVESPTRNDALVALETLEALLDEYQFSDGPSRSVALSMMISPLIRALLPLVPLHCVSAPVAGSGKSYLSSLASAIAGGRYCPVIPPADKKEEFEKRLIGALLAGMPIISFDNINGVLDDGTLCQALEQRIIEIRPLGTSKPVTIEQRTTWFANGNNIEVARDLTRRTVMCRLDRNDERPELHEYTGRPFELVIRNRARYIAACLTIVRAYIVAGRPGKLVPLASFEEWSDNLRSALVWLGRADPCDSMVAVRQGDSKLQKLRVLFLAWATTLGIGMAYLAKEIVKIATDRKNGSSGIYGEPATEPDPELWDALYDCCGNKNEIEARSLGEYLAKQKDSVQTITPDEGKPIVVKLVREEDSHSKRAKWALNEC